MSMWQKIKAQAEINKRMYPKGTRIKLINMNDSQPVPSGTMGTVEHVDDLGQIHMKWDNGRALALVTGEDEFEVVEQAKEMNEEKEDIEMNFGGM